MPQRVSYSPKFALCPNVYASHVRSDMRIFPCVVVNPASGQIVEDQSNVNLAEDKVQILNDYHRRLGDDVSYAYAVLSEDQVQSLRAELGRALKVSRQAPQADTLSP